MICKFCGKEAEDDHEFCPYCGKKLGEEPQEEVTAAETEQEQEAPAMQEGIKMTPGKIALTIVAAVVVLALLIAVIAGGMHKKEEDLIEDDGPGSVATVGQDDTQPEETVPPTIPADGNPDDVTCKGSYTASDEDAAKLASNVVATMGDTELTAGELQVYYWMEVFSFLQQYGAYTSYFGLDMEQPLDMQVCDLDETKPMTWQQFFLGNAIDSWHCYEAMRQTAEENNYKLSDEEQANLDSLADQITEMALKNGFESVEDLVAINVGVGASLENYVNYIKTYTVGYNYFDMLSENMTATDEEIEAYYKDNVSAFEASGITEDSVYVDVRHILFMPQGGTEDENGKTVYSEEEWEACRKKAQDALDWYLAGEQTEDEFASLAEEYSEDPGSSSNGGLYTNINLGQMVQEFEDWCFDESREKGDTGLVKTTYGYHVMFFSDSRLAWIVDATQQLLDSKSGALVPEAMEKHPITVNYSNISLGLADMTAG